MRPDTRTADRAQNLIEDLFTFLLFLQSRDIKLISDTWLPPNAVRALLGLLSDRAPRQEIGARSERSDRRLHALHFLCVSAGLVAPVNGSLTPTPRAADWIQQSPLEQTRWLVRAVFYSPPGQTENWWLRLRMPGWRVLNKREPPYRPIQFSDLADAFATDQLRAIARDEMRTVFPAARHVDAPDPEQQPDSLLDAIELLCLWLGIGRFDRLDDARTDQKELRLTSAGKRLLGRHSPALFPQPQPDHGLQLILQARRGRGVDAVQFAARKETAWPVQYGLVDLAPLVAVAPRTFTLNRDRVLRQLDLGVPVARLVGRIEQSVEGELPRSVVLLLHRWQRDHQRVRLSRVVMLETDRPERMDALLDRRTIRDAIHRRIDPQHAIVRADQVAALTRRLSRIGLAPQRDFPLGPAAQASNGGLGADAHVYVCVAVMHQLADLLPLDYRAPFSVVAELERGLSPSQRDSASELVARLVGSLARRVTPATASSRSDQSRLSHSPGRAVPRPTILRVLTERAPDQRSRAGLDWRNNIVLHPTHESDLLA